MISLQASLTWDGVRFLQFSLEGVAIGLSFFSPHLHFLSKALQSHLGSLGFSTALGPLSGGGEVVPVHTHSDDVANGILRIGALVERVGDAPLLTVVAER